MVVKLFLMVNISQNLRQYWLHAFKLHSVLSCIKLSFYNINYTHLGFKCTVGKLEIWVNIAIHSTPLLHYCTLYDHIVSRFRFTIDFGVLANQMWALRLNKGHTRKTSQCKFDKKITGVIPKMTTWCHDCIVNQCLKPPSPASSRSHPCLHQYYRLHRGKHTGATTALLH